MPTTRSSPLRIACCVVLIALPGLVRHALAEGTPRVTTLTVLPVASRAGALVQLAAKLADTERRPLEGKTIAFRVDGADFVDNSAPTDATGFARVTYPVPATATAGAHPVVVRFPGDAEAAAVEATGTLTLAAPPPTSIRLQPADHSLQAGETITFSVRDNNGRDVTAQCRLDVQAEAKGTWTGATYRCARVGTWLVTAVCNTLTDSTTVSVVVARAAKVMLAPTDSYIAPGETQPFTVTALDAAGNRWNPIVPDADWVEDGAGAFETGNNTYTSRRPADNGKTVKIACRVDGVASNSVTLAVEGRAAGFTLAWDRSDQTFYLCSTPGTPRRGIPLRESGPLTINGRTVTVTLKGSEGDQTATIANCSRTNSLRVRWMMIDENLRVVRQTSTVAGKTQRLDWDGTGPFVGLTHVLGAYRAAPPALWTTVTAGQAPQGHTR